MAARKSNYWNKFKVKGEVAKIHVVKMFRLVGGKTPCILGGCKWSASASARFIPQKSLGLG
jgi:hypothetical protein